MKKQNGIWQGGSKRTLHSGLYASVLAAVVLTVVVLLNLVVRALPTKHTQYDISTALANSVCPKLYLLKRFFTGYIKYIFSCC